MLKSPLRYPGGKSRLAPFLADVLEENGLEGCDYYEPYCGGAGAALKLLTRGHVDRIFLNDADSRIHAFWMAALDDSELFAERIHATALSVDEWRRQHGIAASPNGHSRLDIGFAVFFLNRCNRSGILDGPFGGYEQAGRWKIDARFNRKELARRVLALGDVRDRIDVKNLDALDYLRSSLPRGRQRERVLVYIDPPYYGAGRRLYMNHYSDSDHRKLAAYLIRQRSLRWIVSYDDAPLTRQLYERASRYLLPLSHSLQAKAVRKELVATPGYLAVPSEARFSSSETELENLPSERRGVPNATHLTTAD